MQECSCRGANPACYRCYRTGFHHGKGAGNFILGIQPYHKPRKHTRLRSDGTSDGTVGRLRKKLVRQIDAKAIAEFHKAAQKGNIAAQHNLGYLYLIGNGVPQDYAEAVKWLRLASEQGFARAQSRLGLLYANGQGVPQDYVEAYKWFSLAAASGIKAHIAFRASIERRMTLEQIAEGQKRAEKVIVLKSRNK